MKTNLPISPLKPRVTPAANKLVAIHRQDVATKRAQVDIPRFMNPNRVVVQSTKVVRGWGS